jgi:hypothetical protein
MTNKEIAQALFDTAKAVEAHLSGIYRNPQINPARTRRPNQRAAMSKLGLPAAPERILWTHRITPGRPA